MIRDLVFKTGVMRNFLALKFQHLQGSFLDSSSEVIRGDDCAFAWLIIRPVFRSTLF